MNGQMMTIARYLAREAVKREMYAQGIKLREVEAGELSRAANRYVEDPSGDHRAGHCTILGLCEERRNQTPT